MRELPGIRGVYMGTNVNGRELSDPAFFPVYERCQAAKLPILLHPLNVIGANRLGNYYLNNFLGNPFDTAIAAAHLVFGGVLDRLPKLEVCLPHAGGALPDLRGPPRPTASGAAGDQGRGQDSPSAPISRRFTYDTISHSPSCCATSIATGRRRSGDARHRLLLRHGLRPAAGEHPSRSGLRLSRADQRRIVRATAARLLALR